MIDFKFSYDNENDDLFVYLPDKKSEGAIELGNFILDFDSKGDLVSMQILDASKTLSKFLSKVISLTKIKEMKIEIINFRNMAAIKFRITTDSVNETASILVPNIKERSPVLEY